MMIGKRIAKRYEILEEIGRGGMGIVYKAYDRLMGQVVALKSVILNREEPSGSTTGESTLDFRVTIAQEFRTLASLRHPHIVGVLDYGFDDERNPFITMEFLDEHSNVVEYTKKQNLEVKILTIAQILQALAYLHRRNIIHRDLKPDNVAVVGEIVKVLDFGLSVAREHIKDEEESETIRGTLAYMSPEILNGASPSEASDLYAIGLMAYEIFSGKYPFNTSTLTTLIQNIINETPDVDILDIPEKLRQVLGRLIAKDINERYGDANIVLSEMQDLLGKRLEINAAQIRESYLQAASFVGREKELKQLNQSLQRLKDGMGGVWLLSGEAGVGKSRLLEEFRIQAMVKGLTVLRGQAVSNKGQTYQLWREPLRRFTLTTEPDSMAGAILKALIPDLGTLLDRPMHEAPSLDPQATHQRLLGTIEDLFLKTAEPVVLVLEDLHWADAESLELLARFDRLVHKAPIMVVATLRNDESDVSKQFPQFNKMELSRFGQGEILALSASMIGARGQNPEVVELLQRETEGNAFFLVEVVRALAEEAGDLHNIGFMTLPQNIFAGGMQRIVEHRLSKVPEDAMAFLRLAAIHGRVLDTPMLEKVFGNNLSLFIGACADVSILDVIEDKWRFAHDKLRDGILSRINPAEKLALHKQAAEALEAAYPNDATQAVALAYHWRQAENPQKEYRYVFLAGEQALQEGANRNAVENLLRAKTIMPANTAQTEKAKLERLLGSAYYGLGQFSKLIEHHSAALDLMGWSLPKSDMGYVLGILRHLGQQVAHRWFTKAFFGSRKQYQDTIRNVCEIHYELQSAFGFENVLLPGLFSTFYALNLAETAGIYGEAAYGYAQAGYVLNMMGMKGWADGYRKMTQDIAQKDADNIYCGVSYNVISGMGLANGQWEMGLQMAEAALRIYKSYGHERRFSEASTSLITYYIHIGDYPQALVHIEELRERSLKTNNFQATGAALALQMLIWLRRNQFHEALLLVTELEEQLQQNVGSATEILAYGTLALLYQRIGNREKSRLHAEKAIKATVGTQPVVFYMQGGIAHTVEAVLELLKTASASEIGDLQTLANAAIKYSKDFANFFAFGRPQHYLWDGVYQNWQGNSAKAMQSWEKGLSTAVELVMPFDEALIQYTIAQALDKTSPDYRHRLSRAAQVFEKLEANYYLE